MAYIGDYEAVFGVEKLVVFEVGGHKGIGAGTQGIRQQKAAAAATNGYLLHRLATKCWLFARSFWRKVLL